MKMKNRFNIVVILVLVASLAASTFFILRARQEPLIKSNIKIGVSVYKGDDTFISDILNNLSQQAKEHEQKTGIKVNLDISDASESQRLQNEQVKRYISLGYDALIVNVVDRTNVSNIIDAVTAVDMPVIFFNREPVEEDLHRGKNLYYVGSDAKESAVLQGEILAQAWEENKSAIDLNGNGIMDYVILEGELGHQDATIRTKWAVQRLVNLDVPLQKLDSGVANWSRSQAAAIMEQWIALYGKNIEVVIANNDDMALGALDALDKFKMEKVSIVGIDATAQGIEAVKNGRMLGTVDCDSYTYAGVLLRMASSLIQNEAMPEYIAVEKDRYVRIKLQKFTE